MTSGREERQKIFYEKIDPLRWSVGTKKLFLVLIAMLALALAVVFFASLLNIRDEGWGGFLVIALSGFLTTAFSISFGLMLRDISKDNRSLEQLGEEILDTYFSGTKEE